MKVRVYKLISIIFIAMVVVVGWAEFAKPNICNRLLDFASSAQPTSLFFSHLHASVNIYRDKNGIPHINAGNNEDAFFALGYVHAQDRFWQMEFQRRVASGTLSELFGKKTVEIDKYLRTYGFYHAAELAWPAFDKQTKSLITSYTKGINAYIQQGLLPLEVHLLRYQPRPWTVIDSIAWQKMMSWNLQNHSWSNKITYALAQINFGSHAIEKYFPDYPGDAPVILPEQKNPASLNADALKKLSSLNDNLRHQLNSTPGAALGSNGWVMSGSKTVSGKPYLANDIHLSLTAPNLWYLVELHSPYMHVTGASIPGMPAIAIGHNDKIAWGVTSGYNDAAELYLLNKDDTVTYHNELIKVRNSADINIRVYETKYGPVINQVTPELHSFTQKIVLKWPALLPNDTTIQSFIKINSANNWLEFKTALKDFVAPTQNFLYADVDGNIAYYYPGLLPIRTWKSLTPVPTNQQYQWQGYIPFEKLPQAYNPEMGYIATANNKITHDQYPFSINARWPITPYRINRILELIQQKSRLSMEDISAIQADVKSNFWIQLKPYLLKTKPLDENSRVAMDILKKWSGDMEMKNAAPTIFSYWISVFTDNVPEVLRQQGKTIEPLYLLHKLQNELTAEELQITLKIAMQKLVKEQGSNQAHWQWGDIHRAEFIANGFGKIKWLNAIWNRSIKSPGGNYTVNVGGYDPDTFTQTKGATYRQIIDLSNLDNSRYIIPMGQSGNPLSHHYSDLLHKWRDGRYVTIPSTPPCVLGQENCLVLGSSPMATCLEQLI